MHIHHQHGSVYVYIITPVFLTSNNNKIHLLASIIIDEAPVQLQVQ